jgi:predicted SAM-dependent methyltransferase
LNRGTRGIAMLKGLLLEVGRALGTSNNHAATVLKPAQSRLHLGCGTNVIPGWTNVDLGGGGFEVEKWDLTKPLPIGSDSVDFIFNEHFIEHITREEALSLLLECNRVIKKGGVHRISTPNLEKLVNEYQNRRTTEWSNVNWIPGTPCQLMNEGMRSWGHQFVYDVAEFHALMNSAGFANIVHVRWRQSEYSELRDIECRPFHDEIIVEATK